MRCLFGCLIILPVLFSYQVAQGQSVGWEPTGLVDTTINIRHLFITSDGVLLIGAYYLPGHGFTHGLLRSDDAGASWQEVGPRGVNRLVEPKAGVLIAVGWNGIHRSGDGGTTWDERLPRPQFLDCAHVQFVTALKLGDGEIFSASLEEQVGSGAACKEDGRTHISTDQGITWSAPSASFGLKNLARNAVPFGAGQLLIADLSGNVFFGDNELKPMELVFAPGIPVTSVAAQADSVFYVGTGPDFFSPWHPNGRGVFRSVNYGASWQQINYGLSDTSVTDIRVLSADTLLVLRLMAASSVQSTEETHGQL